MRLHRHEIAVIFQRPVAMFAAEGADDDVRGLPYRDPERPQLAIIAGDARIQVCIQERHHNEWPQAPFDPPGAGLVAGALQAFEQDEIADQPQLRRSPPPPAWRRRGLLTPQMRDPDRAIDEDQGCAVEHGPHGIASSRPPAPIP